MTLELDDKIFSAALSEALQSGKEMQTQDIIRALNTDAVITTNIPTQWLTKIVEVIESV